MDIKIIATDLDGTALGPDSRLSPNTTETLKMAADRGIEIVAATGRAYRALPKDIKNLDFIRFAVTSNGARVVDLKRNKTIYENFIDENKAIECAEILEKLDMNIEVFFDGKAFIGTREYQGVMEGTIPRRKDYIKETRIPVDNIFALMKENADRIENVNVNYTDLNTKEKVEPILARIQGVTLTSSVPMNHEIEGLTTSKADALTFIMDKLNLSRDNLMAFGDNPNDIEMIRLAGLGVAMGNGEEEVRREADFITKSNYEDGVAHAIRKFIKK